MSTAQDTMPALALRGFDREFWVGLFVLLGVISVLALLFAATEPATFRGRHTIVATVPDAAGLRAGDSVMMRGVKIGRVRDFSIEGQQVLIRMEVDRKVHIPADSQVRLSSVSLLGDVAAEVIPGRSTEPLPKGAVIKGVARPGAAAEVEGLADQAGDVLKKVDQVLDDETVKNMQASSADLSALLDQLSQMVVEQRRELGKLSRSLSQSANGLERLTAGPELERAVERLDSISAKMTTVADTIDRSTRSAESVLSRVDRGEGSLGRLTKDDALYTNANQAVQNLNRAADSLVKLTEDFRKNPKKYINVSIF